jgi:hypothetical protein
VIATYTVGLAALVALALAWTLVQQLWVNAFPGESPGGDALAGRLGCHGCGKCTNRCKAEPGEPGGPTRVEEES